ncbi:unnamed protein product [Gongylonema pulchrum]|uniref:Aurora kinase n=1 Tax=Gongylonema pulchrum TaxID=637853 RepID=A0A183E5W2_9BILA|nr:unnamed protein product [Gongylonema pulchrum]
MDKTSLTSAEDPTKTEGVGRGVGAEERKGYSRKSPYAGRKICLDDFEIAHSVLSKAKLIEHHKGSELGRMIENLSQLRHPNILRFYNYFYDDNNIYMIMEYAAGGKLSKELEKCGRFAEKRTAKYCREKNVCCRDTNPKNIYLGINDEIKIANFGWGMLAPTNKRRSMRGTEDYLSPEIIQGIGHDNGLWAVGVICYELLVGKPPFKAPICRTTHRLIVDVKYEFPDHVSAGARDLISKLLVKDPAGRLPLEDIMAHLWILKHTSGSGTY